MSDAQNTETAVLSAEDKAQRIDALPDAAKSGIIELNAEIRSHNANVALIKAAAADKEDPTKLLTELAEIHKEDDAELNKILTQISKLNEQVEKLWTAARKRAEAFVTEKPSEEQVKAAQESVKSTGATIRTRINALKELSAAFFGSDLTVLLDDLQTTRGVRTGGSTGAGGAKISRPRYAELYFRDENGNYELSWRPKNTPEGEIKNSMLTTLAADLTKRLPKGQSIEATEIQAAFIEFLKGLNQGYGDDAYEKLTKGQVMEWVFTKPITDSEGKQIDAAHFNLKFVK